MAMRRARSDVVGEADAGELPARGRRKEIAVAESQVAGRGGAGAAAQHLLADHAFAVVFAGGAFERAEAGKIGRASCRDRVCQYVSVSGVAGSLKKKTTTSIQRN